MGCVSGKVSISMDERLRLEISKVKGQDIEVNLIDMVKKMDKVNQSDRDYIKKEVIQYMNSP